MAPGAAARGSSLYVGGLDARVCTELLHDVFSLAGNVTLCRVVSDKHTGASLGFGFVDYAEHKTALAAKDLLNGRVIYGHELTVDWAHANNNAAGGGGAASARAGDTRDGIGPDGEDISNHYCLFIGNLDSSVTDADLRTAFSAFGECSSAQVSRDSGGESRRCAFVSFKDRAAAQAAIDGLHSQVIADRPMRVDWARTKTNAATRAAALGLPDVESNGGNASNGASAANGRPALDFATIAGQTPPTFTTAYISGLPPTIDEAALRTAFDAHGPISDVRIPESARAHGGDKVYAFVVYSSHESAARAICEAQKGLVVAGRQVAVQWGRESSRAAGGGGGGGSGGGGARGMGGGRPGMGVRGGYGVGYAPVAQMGYPGGGMAVQQGMPGLHGMGYAQHPPASYSAAVASGHAMRGGMPGQVAMMQPVQALPPHLQAQEQAQMHQGMQYIGFSGDVGGEAQRAPPRPPY